MTCYFDCKLEVYKINLNMPKNISKFTLHADILTFVVKFHSGFAFT